MGWRTWLLRQWVGEIDSLCIMFFFIYAWLTSQNTHVWVYYLFLCKRRNFRTFIFIAVTSIVVVFPQWYFEILSCIWSQLEDSSLQRILLLVILISVLNYINALFRRRLLNNDEKGNKKTEKSQRLKNSWIYRVAKLIINNF
jgi:hypothetical protein